jgi:hypothetical protein
MDIKKLPHNIIVSFRKFLRGEEDFWITLLGWGMGFYFVNLAIFYFCFLLYIESFFLGMTVFIIDLVMMQIIGIWSLCFFFVYPFIFIFSLLKSSLRNAVVYVILAFVVILPLLLLYIALYSGIIYLIVVLNSPLLLVLNYTKSLF